jgi:type IV protein arginine methyltransferase
MGIKTKFETIDIDVKEEEWKGLSDKYWTLNHYYLPICIFSDQK